MGRIAFVFSGQGDQYSGMGKKMFEEYPCAAEVFGMCDTLRPGTSEQCFNGTDEELKETANTQPCLFAVELAMASVLEEKGIKPSAVAGFSLGEVVACSFAGMVSHDIGFKLVCRRGELMQRASEKIDTSMAAVVKLSEDSVYTLCSQFDGIYPVNFNCPGQITVSGLSSLMPAFTAAVKAAGGRAIPLKVKGGFHSPFMKEASEAFAKLLETVSFSKGNIDVYSNLTAQPYTDDIKGLLSEQICHPVRWEKTVRNMIGSGVDTFIEIGPGKTLTNMIGKIDAGVRAYSASEMSVVLSEVKPC